MQEPELSYTIICLFLALAMAVGSLWSLHYAPRARTRLRMFGWCLFSLFLFGLSLELTRTVIPHTTYGSGYFCHPQFVCLVDG
jgi:hypothetical protein